MIQSKTYVIEDILKYIPNARVSGAGRFVSDYTIPMDNLIEFRIKNAPNHYTIGFGNASTNDGVFERNGSSINLYRNVNANKTNMTQGYLQILKETDFSFYCKKYVYSSGHVGFGCYWSSTTFADYWECGNTGNRLIVQTYDTDESFEVDILIHSYSI